MTWEPEPSEACERKCYDCGNVAMHKAAYTPWVLCSKCGSQDTRRTKLPPPTREQQLEADVSELVGLLRESRAVVGELDAVKSESRGVDGWHLNGAVAYWNEFDALEESGSVLNKIDAAIAKHESGGQRLGAVLDYIADRMGVASPEGGAS